MKQNLRVSLGAVVLALATLAAVIFALLNFDQRNRYDQTYDGVTWIDTEQGVEARHVAPNSPASHTAIHSGDILVTFNGAPISRAAEVARWLERAGLWTLVHYKLSRNGQEFETPLVTAPAEKPLATENYLRAVGLLYLFIGLFIFIRRWNAPRAVHFYIFCLASFILWSFHFSGKLDTFDWEIYWSEIAARLLVPALLLHFALVFPGRTESRMRTTGTLAAVYLFPPTWMKLTVTSLVLIPLCFAYAIIRYRLMDVDIIFKRGLAYTAATAAVATVYFSLVALCTYLFHAPATGPVGGMIAIVIAAFLFQPLREWIQARLDRFFYRDRLDYRRTLIEFGRTLTNEVRLDPMLGSVMDRISQTLLVDRLAIFVENAMQPGRMRIARSLGVRLSESMDLSFLDPARPEFARGALFFESPRGAKDVSDSVRRTLEQLDLNYFIPCRIREHTVAVLGLGKTVDGDFPSTDDG